MNALELLQAAKAKIADPKNWTKTHLARNDKGVPRMPLDADAVCWCAIGAISSVVSIYNGYAGTAVQRLTAAVFERGPEITVGVYNDTHSHADVMSLFDRAIELELLAQESQRA